MVYDVTDFQREVIEQSYRIPIVVDFWAEWCGPCRVLGPVLERLASQQEDRWVLAKVNTEELQEVAMALRIQSIPNVKMFFGGEVIGEFVGALPEASVRQWIEKTLPGQNQNAVDEAKALLNEGYMDDARNILQEIVAAEPGNTEAKALLAKTYLFSAPEQAVALISGIDDPTLSELTDTVTTFSRLFALADKPEPLAESPTKAAYLAAIGELRKQQFDAALEAFIDIIRNDRYYDDDGSRKACIAIFKYVGEEHPTTISHRREFSSALY